MGLKKCFLKAFLTGLLATSESVLQELAGRTRPDFTVCCLIVKTLQNHKYAAGFLCA